MPASSKKTPSRGKSSTPSQPAQAFELRRSSIQGRGAFALRPIPEGERIIEYLGERITQAQADERYDDSAMSRHHTFLFSVDDDTVIDAGREGNDARFINHSCDPNCQAVLEDARIFIEALRDIAVGEELGYDYAYERTEDMGPEEESLYLCRCGAANCRGTILAPPKKKPAAKKASRQKTKKKAPATSGKKTKGPAKDTRKKLKSSTRSTP
jgi:uncharacterized protein